MKDTISNLMMENKEVKNVRASSTYTFSIGHYTIEIVFDEPDIMVHLFSEKYPDSMKDWLIEILDSMISDKYNVGYEPYVKSWFIRVFGFAESRFDPVNGAVEIVKDAVNKLLAKEAENGFIRVPKID